MNDHIFFSLSEDGAILMATGTGEISLERMWKSWESIRGETSIIHKTKGVVLDFRNASLAIEEDELPDIFRFVQKNIHLCLNKRMAIIMNCPKVALAYLLKKRYKLDHFEIFNSEGVALEWVSS